MSNLLIAYDNKADGATLTGGSWNSTLPLNNLKDGNVSKVARSADAARTSTRFRCKLAAVAHALRAIGLRNHTVSSSAQWRAVAGTAPFDVSFDGEVLDDRLTASGGANGRRINSAGVFVSATAPRWHYLPQSPTCRLLIEPARTNYILNSDASTGWTACTLFTSTGAFFGVDGFAVTQDVPTFGDSPYKVGATLPLGTYTYSLYLDTSSLVPGGTMRLGALTFDVDGVSSASADFNTTTGSITPVAATGNATYVQAKYEVISGTKVRMQVTVTFAKNGTAASRLYITSGTGDNQFVVGLPQIENGVGATTPIATAGSSVTRSADVVTSSGASFTGWYTQGPGTLLTKFYAAADLSTAHVTAAINNGTYDEHLVTYYGTASLATVRDGAVEQAALTGTAVTAGAANYTALAWATNDFALCTNGGTVATDSSGTLPTPDRLMVGADAGGNQLGGCVERITYWPTRQANAVLQSLTTSGADIAAVNGHSSGWLTALQMTWRGSEPSNWGAQYDLFTVTSAAIAAQYITIEIIDTANTAGYVDLGRLYVMAEAVQPEYGAEHGLQDTREDLSSVVTSASGRRYGTARTRRRGAAFSLPLLTQAEGDAFHELQAAVGTLEEVVYVPYHDDLAASQRYGGLGFLDNLSPLAYPSFANRSMSFEWKEKL